jgi:hypothetical protein
MRVSVPGEGRIRDARAAHALVLPRPSHVRGLFGHKVVRVTERDGFVEYACFCGHSFLRSETSLSIVRHPPICVVAGHRITYVGERAGFSEYVCRDCGHPFCFAGPQRTLEGG